MRSSRVRRRSVFTNVPDDMDNFRAAVDAAVEIIAPQVNAHRDTVISKRDKAVLTEALWHFARSGGSNMDEFVSLLSDLPDDASTITKATMIAAELADRLRSARVNDRLFAGSGKPVEPADRRGGHQAGEQELSAPTSAVPVR